MPLSNFLRLILRLIRFVYNINKNNKQYVEKTNYSIEQRSQNNQ